jgi:hypothetical protein
MRIFSTTYCVSLRPSPSAPHRVGKLGAMLPLIPQRRLLVADLPRCRVWPRRDGVGSRDRCVIRVSHICVRLFFPQDRQGVFHAARDQLLFLKLARGFNVARFRASAVPDGCASDLSVEFFCPSEYLFVVLRLTKCTLP